VDSKQHCVHIHNAADRTAAPIVGATAGTAGSAHRELKLPRSACFVHRDGVNALLICDRGNDRVLEVTAGGEFMRAIALPKRRHPCGIAERDGVIVVSLHRTHAVVLLSYESGAVKSEVTIGSGAAGNTDGELSLPKGGHFHSRQTAAIF
jgi:hypothetical protein